MRVTARFLLAGLCVTLIFSVMRGQAGSHADVPEHVAAFHKPHHPLPAIEPAPASAATSFSDGLAAALVNGFAPPVDFSAKPATQRTSRAIAAAPEAALHQRPPPRTLLA